MMKGYQRKAAKKRAKAHQREMRREQAIQAKASAQPTLETCLDEDEEVLCSVCAWPLSGRIFGYADELDWEEPRCAVCMEAKEKEEEDSGEGAIFNNEGVVAGHDRKKDARYETAQEAVRRDAGEGTEAKGVMKEIQQRDEATEKAPSAAAKEEVTHYETARGAVRRGADEDTDARKGRETMTKGRQQCAEAMERAQSADDKKIHYEATQVARRGQSTLLCEMDYQGHKGDVKIRYEAAEKARREEYDRLEVSKRRLEDLARRATLEKMRYEATMKGLGEAEAEMIAVLARCEALQPREGESKEKKCYEATELARRMDKEMEKETKKKETEKKKKTEAETELEKKEKENKCYEATEDLARRMEQECYEEVNVARRKVLVQCGIKPAAAMPCREAIDATARLKSKDTNKGRMIKIIFKSTSTEKTRSAQEALRLQRSEAGRARRERKALVGQREDTLRVSGGL